MEEKKYPLQFRGTNLFALFPLVLFAAGCVVFFVLWKAFDMENLAMGGFVALIVGSFFAKNMSEYWKAVVKGMSSEMAGTLALILLVVGIFTKLMARGGVAEGFVYLGRTMGLTGSFFVAFTFLAVCVIATATGTSIGTLFSCFPIFYPSGILLGGNPVLLAGAILSGAVFGDNLGPISDTTIASAATQEFITKKGSADVGGVVASRFRYAIVAAIAALVLYLVFGGTGNASVAGEDVLSQYSNAKGLLMLIPVIVLLAVAIIKRDIFISISCGIFVGIIVGLSFGIIVPADILSNSDGALEGFLIDGIKSMLGTIGYLYAVFGIMGVLQESGTLDRIITGLVNSKLAGSIIGTELIIGFGTMISSVFLGAANGPAIIMYGPIANNIGRAKGLHPYRRANLMDGFASTLPVILPFTSAFIFIVVACVQGLMAEYSFIESLSPFAIAGATFHCWLLFIVLMVSVVTGWGRSYESKNSKRTKDPSQAVKPDAVQADI